DEFAAVRLWRHLHIDKTCLQPPGLDPLDRRRSGDAATQQGCVRLQLGRQRRGVDDIGDGEPATRLQHTERLAEYLRLVRDQVDYAVGQNDVGGIVGDRQMFELAQAKLDIGGVDPGSVFARLFQHLVCHVDPYHPACRAHLLCGKEAVETRAAAEIDHDLAGL